MYYNLRCFLAIGFVFILSGIKAQNNDLLSPYQAVYTHLYYLQKEHYDVTRASQPFLNIGDSLRAQQLAIQLKQIWDSKGMYVLMDKIPDNSNYVDSLNGKAIFTVFSKEMPEIYLAKLNGGWYYSATSEAIIPAKHEALFPFGLSGLISQMPTFLNNNLLGLSLWQWLFMFFLLLVGLLLQWVFSKIIQPIIQRTVSKRWQYDWSDKIILRKISKYLAIVSALQFIQWALPLVMLPIFYSQKIFLLLYVVKAIFVAVLALRLVDLFMIYVRQLTGKTASKMDDQLSPIIYRALQVIVILFTLIYILQKFNVNVTALFAGLSIGGLALALAAQDTVKNLIGSATIFIDKPFQIGDYIQGGSFEGTVIEVGFRTTRMKASDTSIISVPNGNIANLTLTNKGVRVYRLYNTTLGLEYGTPIVKIEAFMEGLKGLILNEDKILKENYFIGLVNLGESTLDIMFRFYIDTLAFDEELSVKNQINLDILSLAEKMSINFAFPSRTIFLPKAL